MEKVDFSQLRDELLTQAAQAAIPAAEQWATALWLRNEAQAQKKAQYALDRMMESYASLTAGTPLALTQLDDSLLRRLGEDVLKRTFEVTPTIISQSFRLLRERFIRPVN